MGCEAGYLSLRLQREATFWRMGVEHHTKDWETCKSVDRNVSRVMPLPFAVYWLIFTSMWKYRYTLPPNSRKLILQLRGKALWENAEKEEGLLAALAVVIDQTEWATREERFKRGSERKSGFLKAVGWKLRKWGQFTSTRSRSSANFPATRPIAGIVGLLEELYQNSVLGDEQKDSIKNIFRAINTLRKFLSSSK